MPRYRAVILSYQTYLPDCAPEVTEILETSAEHLTKRFYKSALHHLYDVASTPAYDTACYYSAYITADSRYICRLNLLPHLLMTDGHEHTFLGLKVGERDVERLREHINYKED